MRPPLSVIVLISLWEVPVEAYGAAIYVYTGRTASDYREMESQVASLCSCCEVAAQSLYSLLAR